MKKKHLDWLMALKKRFRSELKTLLLCTVILIGTNFQTQAALPQEGKVNLTLGKTTFKAVFDEIQKQTGYIVMFNNAMLDKHESLDLNVKSADLKEVLQDILKEKGLIYKVTDEFIIIEKDKSVKPVQQEKKELKGTVTDKDGNRLPGVSVVVKGTTTGVATDIIGNYSIQVENENVVFVFSFVGMLQQEITYTGQKVIDVVLKYDAESLDEVVVTGYGNIEKRKLSSSVVTLSAEKLKDAGVVTVDNMLEGKIAGVSVVNSTSTAGAAPKIRIRGASSISGNREPIWVVDGVILHDPVPISPSELNSLDNINLIGNAISSLNPEDIERIDVLKDASATAIYGVKAANGVIVVTTKNGKKGAAVVNYSTNFTVNTRPAYSNLNRMNSAERIEMSQEIRDRGLTFGSAPSRVSYEGALYDYNAKKITYAEFLEQVQSYANMNTDWYDILFRNSLSQTHNLSISGGDEKTNYYFSGGFSDSKGTFIDNDNKKYNALLKVRTQLTDKFKLGVQLRASHNEKNYAHESIDPYQYAYSTSRAIPAYNADGSRAFYNKSRAFTSDLPYLKYNILEELENSGRDIEAQEINFQTDLEYEVNNDLKLRSIVNVSRTNTNDRSWFNEKTYAAAKLRTVNLGEPFPDNSYFYEVDSKLPYGGKLSNSNTRHTSYTIRADMDYRKTLSNVHEFSVIAGLELSSSRYEGLSSTELGYLPERGHQFTKLDPSLFLAAMNYMQDNKDVVTDNLTNIMSFYGAFTYAYDNRYIANFNIRTDGSNKFGQDKNNRFLPVWSVSGRWNAHNESFLKNVNWLNQFALRASYGIQGNVSPDSNPNLIVYLQPQHQYSGHYYSTLNKLPNPNLTWEKTTSYNLAADFALLDGRVSGSVEVYNKKGEDMIVTKDISATTGVSGITTNAGNIENRGYDLSLNFTPIRNKNWTWMLSVNGGKNTNKVTDAGKTDLTYQDYLSGNAIIPGHSLNSFYSYKFGGLDENGLPTFNDTEETPGITKEEMYAKMLSYSGTRTPDIEGGFSTTLKYKGWSLGAVFFYSLGRDVRLNPLYMSSGQELPDSGQNMDDIFVNRWRNPGDENRTNIPVLSNDPLRMGTGILYDDRTIKIADNKWEMYNKSDLRVASGDFLRLRSVTLMHSLAPEICSKLNLSSVKLRFEATNLWTLKDKKLRDTDPQQVDFGSGSASIPLTPSFTLGLNVTF